MKTILDKRVKPGMMPKQTQAQQPKEVIESLIIKDVTGENKGYIMELQREGYPEGTVVRNFTRQGNACYFGSCVAYIGQTCEVGSKKMLTTQKTFVEMKSKNETAAATQSKEPSVIGFLEKYLPNFYSSDAAAYWNDLKSFLNYEMTHEEHEERGEREGDIHYRQVFSEYKEVQNELFEKAFNAYTQGKQSLRLDELIKNYFGSSNEDRKELNYLGNILSFTFDKPNKYKDYSEVFRDYLKVTDKLFNAAIQEREKITAQKSKPSPILEQIMNATAGQHKQQPTESHSIRERSKHKM